VQRNWLRPGIDWMLAAILTAAFASNARAQGQGPTQVLPARRQITVGLPVPRESATGELIVVPNVQIAGYAGEPILPGLASGQNSIAAQQVSGPTTPPMAGPDGPLPEMVLSPDGQPLPGATGALAPPSVDARINSEPADAGFGYRPPPANSSGDCVSCRPRGRIGSFTRDPTADIGIGEERVGLAPSELDVTQPFSNFRIRAQGIWNEPSPDRAEFLWAKSITLGGRGPAQLEQSVNYQELRFYLEQAVGTKFSMFVDLPMRWVDPVVNANSAGFSDMNTGTKLLLIDGKCWQITQQMRMYIPTGSTLRGLGNGHMTIEPGLLARYHYSDQTYLHYNLKFWIPVGTDVGYQGLIVNYGAGVSHVLYDGDVWAVIPTFEMVMWSVMTGEQTIFPSPVPVPADSQTILNLFPGVRWVRDCGCQDLGLFEGYLGVGFPVTANRWYDTLLRFDLRWSY